VTSMVMPKHLVEKLDHFLRCDAFVEKPKQQLPTTTNP